MKKWITLCSAFLIGLSTLIAQESNLDELTQNRKDIIVKVNKRFLGNYSIRINLGDQLDVVDERYNYDNRLKNENRGILEFETVEVAVQFLNDQGYYFNPNKGVYWDHPEGAKNDDLRRNGTAKIGDKNPEENPKIVFGERMVFTNSKGKIASTYVKKEYKYPYRKGSLATVYFETNSSVVKKKEIQTVVKAMNSNPKMRVRLEGNSDMRGASELNMTLAKARVQACLDLLINTYGFNKNRFDTKVKGEENPVSNKLYLNRRVDFIKVK